MNGGSGIASSDTDCGRCGRLVEASRTGLSWHEHRLETTPPRCYRPGMTEQADDSRVERRAELLPEERAVGSDDPEEQARAILEESVERTEQPEKTRDDSTQTPGYS
jgi:hypothetical protein